LKRDVPNFANKRNFEEIPHVSVGLFSGKMQVVSTNVCWVWCLIMVLH